jgi:two-component system nitrate/nitrite sensor histidine kinase NarX
VSISFEIRLADQYHADMVNMFTDWVIRPHPVGGTLLVGVFADQAPLFDALQQIRVLGLTLISVVPLPLPNETVDEEPLPLVEQASEPYAHDIFDAVSDGLAIRDREGLIVAVNSAYCQLYGYSREALLGTITDPPLTPEQRPIFDAYLATVNTGGVFRSNGWQRHADGHRIYIEMRAVPFRYRGVPHILDLARDTTEQMRTTELAEQRADERARELAALLEVSRQIASTLDLVPLLQVVITQLRAVIDYTAAAIFFAEGRDTLRAMVYSGPIPQEELPQRWSIGPARPQNTPLEELIAEAEHADRAAHAREPFYSATPVIIPDVRADTALARAYRTRIAALLGGDIPEYVGTWMGVPLISRGEVIGVLAFDHDQVNAYNVQHARIALAAAGQAAAAIANARLIAEVQSLAAQTERQRLARELHDAVTQQLFSASLIGEVLPQIWATNPERGAEYLEDLRLLTKGALAEMRTLLVELRPAALTDTLLPDLLQHLTTALSGRIRVPVDLQVAGSVRLPDDVHIALYRVAQEALQNVAKHAKAQHVWVMLQLEAGAATLTVRDDGRGFDQAVVPADHFGLAIMHERMAAVGGNVVVKSIPGQGTTLTIHWPAM